MIRVYQITTYTISAVPAALSQDDKDKLYGIFDYYFSRCIKGHCFSAEYYNNDEEDLKKKLKNCYFKQEVEKFIKEDLGYDGVDITLYFDYQGNMPDLVSGVTRKENKQHPCSRASLSRWA